MDTGYPHFGTSIRQKEGGDGATATSYTHPAVQSAQRDRKYFYFIFIFTYFFLESALACQSSLSEDFKPYFHSWLISFLYIVRLERFVLFLCSFIFSSFLAAAHVGVLLSPRRFVAGRSPAFAGTILGYAACIVSRISLRFINFHGAPRV
jgi:hypothetical protein